MKYRVTENMSQEITIQSDIAGNSVDADNAAIRRLLNIADRRADDADGIRQKVFLILRNQEVANVLKRMPLSDDIADKVELYAYTTEDLWSMEMLGIRPESNMRLDREQISIDSRQFVHLVLFGMSRQTQSLAIHAALTSHYPNYCRDNSLRTRISIVADSHEQFRHFQQYYRNLLMNSYRRTVTIKGEDVQTVTLEPKYKSQRKDFVDVEWEFICGKSDDDVLTYKLHKWAQDPTRQLTVAFCYDDEARNTNEALNLSPQIRDIPIWINVKDGVAVGFINQSELYSNVVPFGNTDAQLPDMSAFVKMGQCVNYAYNKMRQTTEDEQQKGMVPMAVATEIPSQDELQALWNNSRLNTAKRWSNIYSAFTLRTKMHSLGHKPDQWHTLFAMSEKEIETLSEVEHNRWSVEELILGYRPTTPEEHAEIQKDISLRKELKDRFIHDDLRNFSELGVDETGKSVKRYDEAFTRSLPLVAYIFNLI